MCVIIEIDSSKQNINYVGFDECGVNRECSNR